MTNVHQLPSPKSSMATGAVLEHNPLAVKLIEDIVKIAEESDRWGHPQWREVTLAHGAQDIGDLGALRDDMGHILKSAKEDWWSENHVRYWIIMAVVVTVLIAATSVGYYFHGAVALGAAVVFVIFSCIFCAEAIFD